MERLKAARRGAGQKMFTLKSVDEDSSDSNSDEDCPTKNEVETEKKESLMVSPQREKETSSPLEVNEAENISMGADFDFFDDGGFNLDINELNNVEGFLEDDNNESEECHSKKKVKEGKLVPQEKCVKAVAGKRKIPPSQRRIQDSDGDDDPQEAPKKRGKKTDTQSSKPVVQTVRQPVTPMPNYNEMATPVLKGELNKFGVRALPKKKMILKLTEIYDYTHQVEPRPQGSKTERAPNKGQPLSSNVAVSDPGDGVEGSGTASSDNSDEEDTEFGDCTVMIDDDVITASQQVNGGNLKERLICYIRDNKELYSKILHFQPLELVSLQQQIKSDGISCPLGKLVDFLDEQCITFTTAGTRAPRRRGRKKKASHHNKPS
ncbi:5'-flap endonuclease [Desmophyllum pertusum]|uniref:Structure-specific endonuclease subunit SLX4 n=1 Tax=Desmophyllum pertusum TaxID=174260 RepID=A0A9W9YLY9_9CNID|nr:5'-flap endonuclease [Desmophyllum pertusum]